MRWHKITGAMMWSCWLLLLLLLLLLRFEVRGEVIVLGLNLRKVISTSLGDVGDVPAIFRDLQRQHHTLVCTTTNLPVDHNN